MAHYNTTNEKGELLKSMWDQAKKQEDFVMSLFREYQELTASDAYRLALVVNRNVPLTSIRRAITDLMNDGRLYKTDKKKIGMYSKPEYFYRVVFNDQLF